LNKAYNCQEGPQKGELGKRKTPHGTEIDESSGEKKCLKRKCKKGGRGIKWERKKLMPMRSNLTNFDQGSRKGKD